MEITNLKNCHVEFLKHTDGPLVVHPTSESDSVKWFAENYLAVEEILSQYGGILLRDFVTQELSGFQQFISYFSTKILPYVYRSTPRQELANNIYTATEYPADQSIPLHNENSYSQHWPKKIIFHCLHPAETGGATPIADSRAVYTALDKNIVNQFILHGVSYVRNYSNIIDLHWEEVFQTNDKQVVNAYCEKNNIKYFWMNGMIELKTQEYCSATLCHPKTNEMLWFNQAHLFHPASLPVSTREILRQEFGEENLPRNACYGDDTKIDDKTINYINGVYHQHSIDINWCQGDILILDNLLYAHGRKPYTGNRKIAVAMV